MFKRILVPLDGSKLAERAIPHVRHFAQIFGAQIVLLMVLDSSPYLDDPQAVEPLNWQIRKAQAELYLQSVAAQLRETGLQAEAELREGRAAETIIDFAHTEGIDLVVLTTHGSSGLSRWNASSVAQKVIDKVFLPLLLVRAYPPASALEAGEDEAFASEYLSESSAVMQAAATVRAEARGPLAGTTQVIDDQLTRQGDSIRVTKEEALYRRILLPIDTSRRAECAITAAANLAQEDTSVIMAAVIRPPELPIPAPYPAELNELIQRFLEVSRQAVADYMEEQQSRIPGRAVTRSVQNPNVSEALHELAEQEDVDLVVLCAHGQTGGAQWPYGSVARNYLEHGDRSVLIIQDVPLVKVRPTAAEMAAEKYGRR